MSSGLELAVFKALAQATGQALVFFPVYFVADCGKVHVIAVTIRREKKKKAAVDSCF